MILFVEVTEKNFPLFQNSLLEIENVSFSSPWSLDSFERELVNRVSHLWAIIVNTEFCGYICFWMFAGEIHLMNIAVHPGRRGKGFGNRLLKKMINIGASEGIEYIWLEVRPSNLSAIALYQREGFREIARRERYYKDTNEDAIIMVLSLSQSDIN